MTPERMKAIRQRLGLSARGMAEALRLGAAGGRTIRRYEAGERQPSGPVTLLYEAYDDGRLQPPAPPSTSE